MNKFTKIKTGKMNMIKYATIPILEKLVEQAERTNKNQYPDM